jgi:hypothetical protein
VLSGLAFDVGSKRGTYKDFNVFVVPKADIDDPSQASNRDLARVNPSHRERAPLASGAYLSHFMDDLCRWPALPCRAVNARPH